MKQLKFEIFPKKRHTPKNAIDGWAITFEADDSEWAQITKNFDHPSGRYESTFVDMFEAEGKKLVRICYYVCQLTDEMDLPYTEEEWHEIMEYAEIFDRLQLRAKQLKVALAGVQELSRDLTQQVEHIHVLKKEIESLKAEIAELRGGEEEE